MYKITCSALSVLRGLIKAKKNKKYCQGGQRVLSWNFMGLWLDLKRSKL